MATSGLSVKSSGFSPLFALLQGRMIDIRPVGRKVAATMRTGGTGSVEDHFASQRHYLAAGGFVPWTPSLRALREGGLTLVKSGAYRAAWTGKGPGAVTQIDKRRVRIGVRASRFPQVNVFQGDATVRGVVPRPIEMNPQIMERVTPIVLAYIATGRA